MEDDENVYCPDCDSMHHFDGPCLFDIDNEENMDKDYSDPNDDDKPDYIPRIYSE